MALTRARFCLVVVGDSATLASSCPELWGELVANARQRGRLLNVQASSQVSPAGERCGGSLLCLLGGGAGRPRQEELGLAASVTGGEELGSPREGGGEGETEQAEMKHSSDIVRTLFIIVIAGLSRNRTSTVCASAVCHAS